jgi:hypothetical protein
MPLLLKSTSQLDWQEVPGLLISNTSASSWQGGQGKRRKMTERGSTLPKELKFTVVGHLKGML